MGMVHAFLNPSSRWYYLLRWLVLLLLGLAIYAQTFGFNFVFDDFDFIVNNIYIRRFDHVHYMWQILPKTRAIGVYSFALNYFIDQLHPQGYHIFNFFIHLLAVGLVWALAAMLFKIAGKSHPQLPFFIAVLFLVHPGQTQAVTYISQRFESMATVFYLGAIYCYLCARISSSKTHKMFLFICSAGLAILGIFTKEVAATIPLMILAVEFIVLNRDPLNFRQFSSGPRYLLIMVVGVIFMLLFMKIVGTDFIKIYFRFSVPSASHDGDIITGGKYVLTQVRVFLTFLRLLILPVDQNVDYDYPLSAGLFDPPLTLVGLGVIGLMFFSIIRLRKAQPLIAFGLAWALITFSINTAPRAHVIFEHKLYLISFGFFLAAVCALADVIKDRKILFGLLIAVIAALSIVSYQRNQVWKNELTLWNDVVLKSPHKARPYSSLGAIYAQEGRLTQALVYDNKAIEIDPNIAGAYYNRGRIFARQSDFSRAMSDLNKAIAIDPDYAQAYVNRGNIYDKQGYLSQALSDYNKAVAINPGFIDAYYKSGNIYGKQRNFAQALIEYNKVIEMDPYVAQVYIKRGNCYAQQGDFVRALLDYNQAVAISPRYAQGYYNRAVIYYRLKAYGRAWEDVDKAGLLGMPIDPGFLEALKKVSGRK